MSPLAPFIGFAYADLGRGPDAFDCWGFAMHVARGRFGVDLPDYRYASSADTALAAWALFGAAGEDRWPEVEDPEPGDIHLFRIGRFVCHTGVCVGGGGFLHCLKGRGSALERLDDWRAQLVSTRRFAG